MGPPGSLRVDPASDCRRTGADDWRRFCEMAERPWFVAFRNRRVARCRPPNRHGLFEEGKAAAADCHCLPRPRTRQAFARCTLRTDPQAHPASRLNRNPLSATGGNVPKEARPPPLVTDNWIDASLIRLLAFYGPWSVALRIWPPPPASCLSLPAAPSTSWASSAPPGGRRPRRP